MGKTCVCGADEIDVQVAKKTAAIGDVVINEGDMIRVSTDTGEYLARA